MSELSTVAGNFAPTKYQITCEGKTYHFRQADGVVLKEWETHRFNDALAALDSLRERLSESAYEKRCDAVVAKKELGEYCFESKVSQEFLKTPPGMMFFLHLVTGCDTAELVRLKSLKGPEVNALLATLIRESFGIKEKKGKKPKKDGPEEPAEVKEHEVPLG